MLYKHLKPREIVKVESVVNAARRVFDKNYVFEGESHAFWELQYIAKGAAFLHSNGDFYTLRQGELTFFQPEEFHVVYGDGKSPCEMWVFSFQCASPLLDKFSHAILAAPEDCAALMEKMIAEAAGAFVIVPEPPDGRVLRRRPGAALGGEQLILNRLEELLILLLRCRESTSTTARSTLPLLSRRQSLADSVQEYLGGHVSAPLCLSTLAAAFGVSVSQIKASYRQAYGCGPMAGFHKLKAARAKELLAQGALSVGEIAAALSFENVYYFSNFFKKQAGMSPTAYRNFVRSAQK